MSVVLDRDGGDLERTRRLGWPGSNVPCDARSPSGAGRSRACGSPATSSPPWPTRPGCSRTDAVPWSGSRWCWRTGQTTSSDSPTTETRMVAVLDELGLTEPGHLDPRDQRGRCGRDPGRDRRPAPVRHRPGAGQARRPGTRERQSGTYTGQTRLTGKGRPRLRVAAWRAVWGALQTNTVYAARYRHLTTREHNKLKPTQAQTVIAAAILRHLHAVITTGQAWDPAHRRRRDQQTRHPGRLTPSARRPPELTVGASPTRHRGPPSTSTHIMGSPVRRRHNPITRCRAQPHSAMQGPTTDQGTDQTLDANRLTLMVGLRPQCGIETRSACRSPA